MKVGFIGLGDQGAPMARMLARAGHELHAWARREAGYAALDGERFTRAGSPADLAGACEMIGLCVRDDSGVREIVLERGLLEAMLPDAVLLVHATVSPEVCRELGAAARGRGVHVLDAPVSGGGAKALERALAVMVGGDAAVFERVRPALEAFADPLRHVGPLGAGQICKLLNNALYHANWWLAHEARELGARAGLDPGALTEIVRAGSGASFSLDVVERGAAALPHALKDVGLLEDLSAELAADDGLLRAAARACADFRRRADAAPGEGA